MKLIRDATNFLESLRRMHRTNEAVVFPNCENSFKCMIRPTFPDEDESEDTAMMYFDLLIIYDESIDLHGKFCKLLEYEYSGYLEDGDFLIETLEISKGCEPDHEDLKEAIDSVELVYKMKICGCFKYFVKDDAKDLCYYCHMTLPTKVEEDVVHQCVVCHDVIEEPTKMILPCCKHPVHSKCVEIWLMNQAKRKCPLCRSETL